MLLLALLACAPKDPTPGKEVDTSFGAELGRAELPPASSLWVDSARAFACAGESGLHVLDIADPTWPTPEEVVSVPCHAVGGESGKVHVAGGDWGLQVVHPGNLAIQGGYDPGYPVTALAVDAGESQAWVAGTVPDTGALRVDGVVTYSAENLNQNKQADLAPGAPVGLAYDSDGVYVARDDGTVDLLGLAMDLRGNLALAGPVSGGAGGGLLAADGLLWATMGEEGLAVYSLEEVSAPDQVSGWLGAATWGMAMLGDRVYLGADEALVVLDVSNPAAPVEVGRATLDGLPRPEGIYVYDDKAWIVDAQDGGFVVVSVDESQLDG